MHTLRLLVLKHLMLASPRGSVTHEQAFVAWQVEYELRRWQRTIVMAYSGKPIQRCWDWQ